jgi:biopolymer transport protein ExbD
VKFLPSIDVMLTLLTINVICVFFMLDLGAGGVKSTTINLAFAEFVKE